MAKILLVGKGGFGDMIPLFALAKALQDRGHAVQLAVDQSSQAACITMGLSCQGLNDLPLPTAGAPRPAAEPPNAIARLRDTLAPARFEAELEALLPLVRQADLVIGNQLAYAAALACRVVGRPWVFSAASPLAIPSRHDAPLWPYLYPWQQRAARLGLPHSLFLPLARWATQGVMRPQARLYRKLRIPLPGHPRFECMYSNALNLLMVSPALAPAQEDWPRHTLATGFAWLDPPFLGGDDQEQAIVAFAQAGAAPIVFAPGGSTRVDPGGFFEQSMAAALAMGRRAILVVAKKFHAQIARHPDILVTGYFPYARLFRHAALVVHSAGIGALGWAARYGVPSLLVPSEWDQFDNARRAQRIGLGRVLDIGDYTAARIASAVRSLEEDQAIAEGLERAANLLAQEDGARVACDAVQSLLATWSGPGGQPRRIT
ncbi:MAG: glycosyltransferase [Thiomonas sp.]